jgi:hypothetical protein
MYNVIYYYFVIELSAVVISSISALVTLIITVMAVMVVVVLVYCAGTRCRRRGQSTTYDTPYNYELHVHVPPLPPRLQRMDSGMYEIISNSSKDNLQNQPQSESKSLDNKLDGEIIANRCSINNSPFNDKSGEATNDIIIAISQSPSSNPDTATKDSSTHSVGTDSPSERANLPLNQAIDDRAEDPNDELGIIPSPNVTENVSYQPSTRFSLERNPAYGTDIAIAPEIETTQNIAYEHSNSTM